MTVDRWVAWCILPFSTLFQLYHGCQCTSLKLIFTSTRHKILSRAFAFPNCQFNFYQGERTEASIRNGSDRNRLSLRSNIHKTENESGTLRQSWNIEISFFFFDRRAVPSRTNLDDETWFPLFRKRRDCRVDDKYRIWVHIHHPLSRAFFVFFSKILYI